MNVQTEEKQQKYQAYRDLVLLPVFEELYML